MAKFLHTGDIHLDSAFAANFDIRGAQQRRGEVMRCVSDIIKKAADVDILLIAGDLFESDEVSADTVSFLKRKFAEIPDTRIFISAGNHDPYNAKSVYAKEDFGANVHIFSGKGEYVSIPEIKSRVWGVSFTDKNSTDINLPVLSDFDFDDDVTDDVTDDFCNILLVHGDLYNSASTYNPISRDYLERCGFDYVALGHIHARTEINKINGTYFAYCGAPEGRGFDECGDMGCYIGDIQKGCVSAEFKRTCIRRMFRLEADLTNAEDKEHCIEIVKNLIDSNGETSDLYRIILTGRVVPDIVNVDLIKSTLCDIYHYIEVRDETVPDFDVDKISDENSIRGEFIRILQNKKDVADIINSLKSELSFNDIDNYIDVEEIDFNEFDFDKYNSEESSESVSDNIDSTEENSEFDDLIFDAINLGLSALSGGDVS